MQQTTLIIKEYLKLSSYYSDKFYDNYRKRESIKNNNYEIIVHWNWMNVIDKKKELEIDFDYVKYNGICIKYFDFWKVEMFIKENKQFWYSYEEFVKWKNELIKHKYIKMYHNSWYYFFTNRWEDYLVDLFVKLYWENTDGKKHL